MGGGIDYENSYEEWEKEQNFKILAALLEKISEEDLRKIFERDYCPIIDVMEARDWQLFWKKINIDEVPKLKEYLSLKKGDFKDLSKKISNPKEKLWVRKMALKLFKGEVISDIRKGDDPRITTIVLDEVKRLKEELHKENSPQEGFIKTIEEIEEELKAIRLQSMEQNDLFKELGCLENYTNEEVQNEIVNRINSISHISHITP